MNRYKTPQSVTILFAVALVTGMFLMPSPGQANEQTDVLTDPHSELVEHRDALVTGSAGIRRDDGSGSGNDDDGGGWTADPDWFQIDSRSGQEMELLPEPETDLRWTRFLSLMRILLSGNYVFGPGL